MSSDGKARSGAVPSRDVQSRQPEAQEAQILAKICKTLRPTGDDSARRSSVAARLAGRVRMQPLARVADKAGPELIGILKDYLTRASATLIEVASPNAVPAAIVGYLRANNLPAHVTMGSDAYLASLPWAAETTLTCARGPANPTDEVGVSHALAGAAETGTLMLMSGAENPVTLSFLPETHIVVLEAADVVASYEDGFARARAKLGGTTMPRTLNMISGPSRTGDIGGELVMGAHGPKRVAVILVGGGSGAI